MKVFLQVVLLCVLVVLLQWTDQGEAVCCPTHRLNKHRLCDDCRDGTPYCGKGRCNWFGCNCVDGCRRGLCGDNEEDRRKRRDAEEGRHHLTKRGVRGVNIRQSDLDP